MSEMGRLNRETGVCPFLKLWQNATDLDYLGG